jgi:hypothetical protein
LEATPEQRLGNVENVGRAAMHPEYVELTGKNGGFDQDDGFNKGTYSDFTG